MTTPLFVLGAHRSGTTLVQRLLNSYGDVTIWGEHEGVLRDVAAAYFRGVESPNLFSDVRDAATSDPRRDWQAWMNGFSREEWDGAHRDFVLRLFGPRAGSGVRYWGFKEIRYGTVPGDRTIDFLTRLFPDARYAFVVRNPFNALASAYTRPEGPRSRADVARICTRWVTRYQAFHRRHRDGGLRSYWLVYEELVAERGDVQRLLADLGRTLGPAQREVLAAEGGRGSSFRDGGVNERWQRLPRAWLAVARHAIGPLATELGYAPPPVATPWRLLAPLLWRRGEPSHRGAQP